jgi:hypothetical protein
LRSSYVDGQQAGQSKMPFLGRPVMTSQEKHTVFTSALELML